MQRGLARGQLLKSLGFPSGDPGGITCTCWPSRSSSPGASVTCSGPEPPHIQITESDAQSCDVTCLRLPGCEGADLGLDTSFWTAGAEFWLRRELSPERQQAPGRVERHRIQLIAFVAAALNIKYPKMLLFVKTIKRNLNIRRAWTILKSKRPYKKEKYNQKPKEEN